MRTIRVVAGLMVVAALLTSAGNSALAAGHRAGDFGQTLNACAHYKNHVYEACTAYIVNDADWSLQPYYKYVHSHSFFAPLKDRLLLKYKGQAQRSIVRRARNWPRGTNKVDGPDITILSARSSLACNRAVLHARESWRVTGASGRTLYVENNRLHTVILRRVPDERFRFGGHVLHAWVVYNLYDGRRSIRTCP